MNEASSMEDQLECCSWSIPSTRAAIGYNVVESSQFGKEQRPGLEKSDHSTVGYTSPPRLKALTIRYMKHRRMKIVNHDSLR